MPKPSVVSVLQTTYEIRPLSYPKRLEFKIDKYIDKAVRKATDAHKAKVGHCIY